MTSQTPSSATPLIVNPPHLDDAKPYGYSTMIFAPSAGRLAFISGQGGQDLASAPAPDFGAQVAQVYANLATVLDAIGALPDQVAKLAVLVGDHDMSKLGPLSENVKRMFGERLPAQTLVPVPNFAIDPMLFGVEAFVLLN